MNTVNAKNILDACYEKALTGIPVVSSGVCELAQDYINKYPTPQLASKALINAQITKCGTSGFITGLGGLITLPIAVPANVSSVLYVQLRMIAAIACIGGYNPNDDEVRTLAYLCLTGSAMSDIVKGTGIKIGEKITINAIKKIPGKVLIKINQKVGFRLFTKLGEKGVINFVKLVPLVGGIVGGGIDVASTKIIANKAYNVFIKGIIK